MSNRVNPPPRVRLIHVGLGGWGLSWVRDVLPAVPAVDAVAYVDQNPATLQNAQAALGIDAACCFASLRDAMAAVDAELVLVCLRTDVHFEIAKAALEAGKHVLVEKPFTSTLGQARELIELAHRHSRRLIVSQNYRFQPAPILAAQLIAQGVIGAVHQVAVDFRRHAQREGFRHGWDMREPLLGDMAIHQFDLLRMVLADEPVRISCRSWHPPHSPFTDPSAAVATIEFARGAVASFRGSYLSQGEATPWAGEWRIDGGEGELCFSSRDRFLDRMGPDRLSLRRGGAPVAAPPWPDVPYTDRAGTLAATAAAMATGRVSPLLSDAQDNIKSLALAHAAVASAERRGAWVELAELLGRA